MGVPKLEERTDYTFEEYLALEKQAEYKHEYHNGSIVAMAGGTINHNALVNRLGALVENGIDAKGKNCTVFNSDMKVRIEKFNKSVYPDVSVVCGDIETYKNSQSVIINPMLFIEVLSQSTKAYDKSEKFDLYRSLPSFKEYMIVYQTVPNVQTWYKEDEKFWRIGSAEGLDKSIRLHSLDMEIQLADIYKRLQNLQDINSVDLTLAY